MYVTRGLLNLLAWASLATLALPAAANSPVNAGDAGTRHASATTRCATCDAGDCVSDSARARSDQRVSARTVAMARTRRCDLILDTGHFPAEEDHIAAYLATQRNRF
jgi:hypothetical protein